MPRRGAAARRTARLPRPQWLMSASMHVPPLRPIIAALALAALLAGCGKTASSLQTRGSASAGAGGGGGSSSTVESGSAAPIVVVTKTGAAGLSTTNTTRLGGADAITDAAAVARAVYPGLTSSTRPSAVALVDMRDWRTALAASVLMSAPLGAPVLFSDGGSLPGPSADALSAMAPTGASEIGGAQVIRVGPTAAPGGYATRTLAGSDPFALAASLEQLAASAHGILPRAVLIVAADGPPAFAMPAAGLSAESGAPILFVTAAGVPAATAAALSALQQPTLYVIGPRTAVAPPVLAQLRRFGTVKHIGGADAVTNAIAVAKYSDGTFGWGVIDPGHGLVFVNATRPLDAAAAAPLSASGQYGPLLLLENANRIPPALAAYVTSIQPAYTDDPRCQAVRGVYNRGWIIGDEGAISTTVQAQLDSMLQITLRSSVACSPIPAQ
jgi:putative cell wall binding repeat protein